MRTTATLLVVVEDEMRENGGVSGWLLRLQVVSAPPAPPGGFEDSFENTQWRKVQPV